MLSVAVRRNGLLVAPVQDWRTLKIVEAVNQPTGLVIEVPTDAAYMPTIVDAEDSTDLIGFVVTDKETGRQVPTVATRIEASSARDDFSQIVCKLDTAVCNENPSFPDPASPPWTASANWTSTGDPATVTAAFLLAQVGSGAAAGWQKFDTITTVGLAGGTVTYDARMQPVLDYVDQKVTALGVVVSGLITGGESTLVVRAITDRPNAIFSPRLHTVTNYKTITEEPGPNWALAGGTGVGTARTTATTDISGGKWPRKRFIFADQRNASGTALTDAAAEAVQVFEPFLELEVTDTAGLRFGADFDLGDTCRVEIGGTRQTASVMAVETSASSAGVFRKVTLGIDKYDPRFSTARLLRGLNTRHGLTETP